MPYRTYLYSKYDSCIIFVIAAIELVFSRRSALDMLSKQMSPNDNNKGLDLRRWEDKEAVNLVWVRPCRNNVGRAYWENPFLVTTHPHNQKRLDPRWCKSVCPSSSCYRSLSDLDSPLSRSPFRADNVLKRFNSNTWVLCWLYPIYYTLG